MSFPRGNIGIKKEPVCRDSRTTENFEKQVRNALATRKLEPSGIQVNHFPDVGKMITMLLEDFESKELSKREVVDRIMDFINHVPDAGEKVDQ